MNQQTLSLNTGTDYQVPIEYFPHEQARALIIILPAMGGNARSYVQLAQALNQQGFCVIIYEQRGHGLSSLRPSHSTNWGYKEYIYPDLSTVLDWCDQRYDLPIFLCGHSIGGHVCMISMGEIPTRFAGSILITTGLPYCKFLRPWDRFSLLMALQLTKILGYFPGKQLKFAGNESKGLFSEWMHLVRNNEFDIKGIDDQLAERVKNYTGPILNIQFSDDTLVTPEMNQVLKLRVPNSNWHDLMIDENDADHRADHFTFLKHPSTTTQVISEWLKQELLTTSHSDNTSDSSNMDDNDNDDGR